MDLTIEGKAFINGVFDDCCIGIKDGKISAIKKVLKADTHFNFGKKLIIPAGVDIHVHFRDPGMTHKEDFKSGSLAAAFGGISCFFDMPNTIPQTTTVQTLSDKIITAGKKSFVDFGIYSGINNNNLEIIDELSKNCSGFKIYLGGSTNSPSIDYKNIKDILQKISKTNKPILFHAEDQKELIKHKGNEENIADHLRNRPSICEEISIKNIIDSTHGLNIKTHICHLSSIEGLELLKRRKKTITCGVTPHHLLLSIQNKIENQTFYKVNPPIRSEFDKEALFNAINEGIIDLIESDHAPHTIEEKEKDFNEAPSGMPGVETMLPLFLYLAKKEKVYLSRLISLTSEKPAELLGISKGRIEVGRDADLLIIDLRNEEKIKSENLHSKCGWTPFENWNAIFPSLVFVRGEKVIEANEIQVSQGFGKFAEA